MCGARSKSWCWRWCCRLEWQLLLDLTTGLLPILTIVAALICIPLATILVNRTVLAEMDRVIAMVAPDAGSQLAERRPCRG